MEEVALEWPIKQNEYNRFPEDGFVLIGVLLSIIQLVRQKMKTNKRRKKK